MNVFAVFYSFGDGNDNTCFDLVGLAANPDLAYEIAKKDIKEKDSIMTEYSSRVPGGTPTKVWFAITRDDVDQYTNWGNTQGYVIEKMGVLCDADAEEVKDAPMTKIALEQLGSTHVVDIPLSPTTAEDFYGNPSTD
jgi:hypothetical protein